VKKKTKKKSEKESWKFPEEINRSILQNGDPVYDVQTVTSINFASTYSKVYVLNSLAKSIIEFYKTVCIGGSLKETPFEHFKVKLHPKQEEKSAEEAWEILLYYFTRADLILEHALPLRLADFPAQLLKEVFISVVQEMEDGEVFVIEGGRADVWDSYTNELGRTLKRNWNKTLPRGAKYWNPIKRAGLLKLYDSTFKRLRDWCQKYHRSRNSPQPTTEDWELAEKNYPLLIPFLKELANSTPHELALDYVSQVIGLKGEHNLRKQLTLARREAAAQER